MKENKKSEIEIKVDLEGAPESPQVIDIPSEKTSIQTKTTTQTIQEVPTITSLLNRKKLSVHKEKVENSAPKIVVGPADQSVSVSRDLSENLTSILQKNSAQKQSAGRFSPPEFSQNIWAPQIIISKLSAALKLHQKSVSLKRRDILGCLSRYFSEIAFLKTKDSTHFQGCLGFGNSLLVSTIKNAVLDLNRIPTIQKEFFRSKSSNVFGLEGLEKNEKELLHAMGFDFGMTSIFVFRVYKKKFFLFKELTGVWICMRDSKSAAIHETELKQIQNILNNIKI